MAANLDPDRWQRIEHVLDIALEREPQHWPAILDDACAGDPALRAEVEALLRRVSTAERFLDAPPGLAAESLIAEVQAAKDHAAGNSDGRRIGAYRLVRETGRGGMSRVFLADRADAEFEQQVAVKLLRAGLDTDLDRARFGAERQILATLNHPNIARLLDAGATEDGQPYVVLEHIDGEPIDDFGDRHGLDLTARLELFLTVCTATQHAHRNLIVHRDLKPSNILVSVDGVVKLLDFGLAKLLEPDVTGGARLTRTGQRWMTPEYAAPEQIRRAPVTTLTDVYQLGAVLYELVTGRLPFVEDNIEVLEDAILQHDPVAPSVAIAATDPRRSKLLRGDLDAIILKALRKQPDERFASVEALGDDLRRHLTGHPVLARRNTAGYLARRFIRRHRMETVAVVGISASLIAGLALSATQARHARAERDRAEAASHESKVVTNFLMGLFQASDPAETRGDTITAGELVRRALSRLEALHGEPADEARMLEVIGQLYQSLGRSNDAYVVLERALDLRRSARRPNELQTAGTLLQLANPLIMLGRFAAADSAALQALIIQERLVGPEHPVIAATLHQMAVVAAYQHRLPVAEAYERRATGIRERALGSDDSLTADSHLSLGGVLQREGRLLDAEREYRRALASYEGAPAPDLARVADAVVHIAYVLDGTPDRNGEAELWYRRALSLRERAYGNRHPMVAAAMSDLSEFLSENGKGAEAVALAREHLEIMRRAYGAEHPIVATALSRVGIALYHANRLAEAEPLFRQAIAMNVRLRGPDDLRVAGVEINLARLLIERRAYAEAESVLDDAIRIRRIGQPASSAATATAEGMLGMLYSRTGRYASSESLLRQSIGHLQEEVGRQQPDLREMYGWLADLEQLRGQREAAARDRAVALAR
jgi:eukaryotic-like serine/threonine-protein kinase